MLMQFLQNLNGPCSENIRSWSVKLREKYTFYRTHRGRLHYDLLRFALRIKIVFLDLHPVHYQFSRSVIIETAKRRRLSLIVTTEHHPALRDQKLPRNVHIIVLPDVLDQLRDMKVDWLITPASDLHPWRIPAGTNTVHLFHSLVSMHAVYKEDAFDGYQHFLACGPHHLREIRSLSALRQWDPRYVYDVGYPKVDALSAQYQHAMEGSSARGRGFQTVLLAPSWHKSSLLALDGAKLSRRILEMGLSLVIRPHPHTFDEDPGTIRKLQEIADEVPSRCILENSTTGVRSLWEADVMISDWSGVAYEFAFATERPVLFINSPQKINSRDFKRHNLPAMEDVCRSDIGVIVEHSDDIEKGLSQLMQTSQEVWAAQIRAVRPQYLFNFGQSAEVSADYILRAVAGQPVPRHIVGEREPAAHPSVPVSADHSSPS